VGIYKRPDGSWWISYNAGSRRFREAGGTKKQAETLLNKRKTEVFEGKHFPQKRKAAKRVGLTMADLSKLWLEHAEHKRSLSDDKQRLAVIVEHFGATTRVATLTTEEVLAFRSKLAAQVVARPKSAAGPKRKPPNTAAAKKRAARLRPSEAPRTMSPATINRYLAVLKSALKLARSAGYLYDDPTAGVKLLAENNARDRIATPEEIEKLLAAASSPKLKLVITLAFETGMRLSEIVGLRGEQLDLKAGIVRLGSGETKSGAGRKVPLSPAALEALRAWPRPVDGGPLFVVHHRNKETDELEPSVWDAKSVSPLFSRLCREVGITGLRLHDARHTALTKFRRENNADIMVIAAISGHRSLDQLRRYQNVSDDELLAAVRTRKAP
jgi:integrase